MRWKLQWMKLTLDIAEKFLKRWESQITWPASWEICMQVKKQQLELDMHQQTGSKLGKEYIKAVYCHTAYLTYMQSTSWKMLGWMKPKVESRLLGEISITSDMQMTPPYGRKWGRTKEPLDECKRGDWKFTLKLNIQKMMIMASGPITSWKIVRGNNGNSVCLVTQSCPTVFDLWMVVNQTPLFMAILQARILEWVAMSFSRESSQPRDWTQVSCIAGRFFTIWATRKALETVRDFIFGLQNHCIWCL